MEDEYGFCRSSEGSYCCGENILTDNHVLMLAYHGHFHNFLSVVVKSTNYVQYILFLQRFNPNILCKKLKRKNSEKPDKVRTYECLYFLGTSCDIIVLWRQNVSL